MIIYALGAWVMSLIIIWEWAKLVGFREGIKCAEECLRKNHETVMCMIEADKKKSGAEWVQEFTTRINERGRLK